MIYPTTIDVLKSIQETHETVIRPALAKTMERSAAATMSHLLRHVALRIEVEGQILADDIATLRGLLGEIRLYLAKLAKLGDGEATRHDAAIAAALQRQFRAPASYPTLPSMAEEAGALRQAMTDSLAYLQSIRGDRKDDPGYQEIRAKIRDYIAEQLRREAEMIEPAFSGQGPRR